MSYLYAAYIIVWVVLIGYIGILMRGFRKLAEEMKDLEQ